MGAWGNSFKRRVRGIAALAVVAGGGLAFMGPVTNAGATPPGGTLYVNATSGHDTTTCRFQARPCQTIAYALLQATSGSLIEVASGAYPQQLVVTTTVTIQGPTSGNPAVIDPSTLGTSDVDSDSSQPQYAIVDAQAGTKVKLKNLTINGANAQSQFNSCSDDFVGVYYHDASGSIAKSTVENIELPVADFGCQQGLGVYVDSDATSPSLSNVKMTKDTVTAYDKNGITCDDPGTTCSISGTTVTGIGPTNLIGQNGIQFYDAAAGTISGDTVSANSYQTSDYVACGLLLYSTGTLAVTGNSISHNDVNAYLIDDGTGPPEGDWTVSGNTVTDGSDNANAVGFGDGIDLDSTSNPVSITDNTVTGGANNGISLFSTTNATVSGNTTSSNADDGIYVGGPGSTQTGNASNNTVSDNTSSKNGQDGILADTDTSTNSFSGNTLKGDVRYDIEDLSTGAGTGGTANTWSSNTCKPVNDSNPSGLCAS